MRFGRKTKYTCVRKGSPGKLHELHTSPKPVLLFPCNPNRDRTGSLIKPGMSYVYHGMNHAGYEASNREGHSSPIQLDLEGYRMPSRRKAGWAYRK